MKKLFNICLITLLLIGLVACGDSKEENNNNSVEPTIDQTNDSINNVDEVKEETYYLYEVSKNEKVNDLLNNVPEMVNYGGGYPKLLWGDSYFEEFAQAFCEGFTKLEVKKVDSINIDDLKYTIEFYWDEDDIYNIYFTEDNVALVDDEAYQILDISYIEGILD